MVHDVLDTPVLLTRQIIVLLARLDIAILKHIEMTDRINHRPTPRYLILKVDTDLFEPQM
jgi:hypothetical protein